MNSKTLSIIICKSPEGQSLHSLSLLIDVTHCIDLFYNELLLLLTRDLSVLGRLWIGLLELIMDKCDEKPSCKGCEYSKHDLQGNFSLLLDCKHGDLRRIDLSVGECDPEDVFDGVNLGVWLLHLWRGWGVELGVVISNGLPLGSVESAWVCSWRRSAHKLLPRLDLLGIPWVSLLVLNLRNSLLWCLSRSCNRSWSRFNHLNWLSL